jgi:plasmid stability protein
MASITIRNLDEALKRKLRVRAAHRNRSMEDEVRDILRMVQFSLKTWPIACYPSTARLRESTRT